jgi:hypothetical protein
MLRTNTVETGTLDLIRKFMSDHKFNAFNLVGGTALALKIGHRISVDIDLFSTSAFNASELSDHLTANYNAEDVKTLTKALALRGKISLPQPWLFFQRHTEYRIRRAKYIY